MAAERRVRYSVVRTDDGRTILSTDDALTKTVKVRRFTKWTSTMATGAGDGVPTAQWHVRTYVIGETANGGYS